MRWLTLLLLLGGCAYGAVAQSWEGRPLEDMIYRWGPPAAEQRLSDGRIVAQWSHARTGGAFVDTLNTVTQPTIVTAFSYHCTVTARTDTQGIVRSVEVDGNIGGCNRLIHSNMAAH